MRFELAASVQINIEIANIFEMISISVVSSNFFIFLFFFYKRKLLIINENWFLAKIFSVSKKYLFRGYSK